MRILQLLKLDPNKWGSIEEWLFSLGGRAGEKGWKFCVAFQNIPPEWLRLKYEDLGVSVCSTGAYQNRLGFFLKLDRIITGFRPELVHVHFFGVYSLIPWFLKMRGVRKIFIHDHASGVLSRKNRVKQCLFEVRNRVSICPADKIIAVSQYVGNRLLRSGIPSHKVAIVYNGVNIERFICGEREEVRQEFGISNHCVVITTVAQLIPEKGVDIVIRAIANIIKMNKNVILIVVGDGQERKALEEIGDNLGISAHIIFAGRRNDVERILACSDIFVSHARWAEACSLALLEAAAAGLPALTTSRGGNPELVLDGVTGMLHSPEDVETLAQQMDKLIRDGGERSLMGQRAQKHASSLFTLNLNMEKILNLYEGGRPVE